MKKEKNSLGELRKEIDTLKSNLSKIKQDKENWFKEKEGLKKQISDFVKKIKIMKGEKDSFNVIFTELRNKRDELNNKVKKLISNIKNLRKERKDVVKKTGIKESPDRIKKKIEGLNEKIETEVLSLKKERKFMDEIRGLKKVLSESKILVDLDNKIESVSRLIDGTRKKAQGYHEKFKEHIKKNKKSGGYIEFISLSKQIDFLKSSQKKAFGMFIDFKNRFVSLNKLLGYKLFQKKKIEGNLNKKKERIEDDKKKREERLLDEKYKEVENKLKIGKKLTTEDLLSGRK